MLSSQPSAALDERIGRFQVLRKIATGGMAELFLARQVGLDGFEKVVAIKRILSHLAHDQDFVQMFQDEARIVAKLHHPNIVQIYDLGKADGTYFIAMEYIPGRNLSSVAKKAKLKGEALPPAHIAHCMSQACEGLYYAHTRHDADGRPLHIVHRDVSPQNIIVAFSGSVKLVDFGIAKAATKIAHTRAGVLKGKYAYMSPEQIRGERTDARSDLFAVGIVLYELLCGQRPFEKENSIQTLKAIVQDEAPPCQSINSAIPDRLADIIARCLEKKSDERFQSAQEVQLALEEFVSTSPQRINNLVISKWVGGLFSEELARGAAGNDFAGPSIGDAAPVLSPRGASVLPDVPGLPLRRGRGGGSISALSEASVESEQNESFPLLEDLPGRSDLIAEGVIERAPSSADHDMSWDQAETLHLSASTPDDEISQRETMPSPVSGPSGPRTSFDPPLYDGATQDSNEDIVPTEDAARAFIDEGGFEALGGGEDGFDQDGQDPWDDQTLGMPQEMSVGAEAASGPRQDVVRTESAPPVKPLVDESSNLSKEILAAAEASAREHDDLGWYEDGTESPDDDPWGDKTAADPGLFDHDGDAVFVHDELPHEDPLDLGLDDGSLASEFEPTADPIDPTVGQEPALGDATIDQSALERALDDAT
ncbi:MAG: serine/threonine-protein kinase, partial [Myxococcota bacterium]